MMRRLPCSLALMLALCYQTCFSLAIANSPSAIEQEIQSWLDEQGTPVFSNVSSAAQNLPIVQAPAQAQAQAQAIQQAQSAARRIQRKPLAAPKPERGSLASLLSVPNQDCQNAPTQEPGENQIEMREQSDGTLSFNNIAAGSDRPPSSRIACPNAAPPLTLPPSAARQLMASLDTFSSQSGSGIEKNPAEHDALDDH
ncbi:hypothetical protein [Undibacterium sp.]|uniref:hypothetical protein n=1 Tax=Undibacterium sp. TaxID=1914977 RepID=UPI0025FD2E1B|nr:hypothetical protein [Undibacterium sp.]